jgi:hypothetical protein
MSIRKMSISQIVFGETPIGQMYFDQKPQDNDI